MAQEILTLESLGEIHQGGVAMVFDEALRAVRRDLRDRPAMTKARDIILKVSFAPREAGADLGDIETTVSVKTSIPDKSVTCIMVDDSEGLHFSSGAPDNARQKTIPME